MEGDDGLEFVEIAEGPTKTRPGGLIYALVMSVIC